MNTKQGTKASSASRKTSTWTKKRPRKKVGQDLVFTTLRVSTTATSYNPAEDAETEMASKYDVAHLPTNVEELYDTKLSGQTRFIMPTSPCIAEISRHYMLLTSRHDDNAFYCPTSLGWDPDKTHYNIDKASQQIVSGLNAKMIAKTGIPALSPQKPSCVANMSLYDSAGHLELSFALESRLYSKIDQPTQQGTISSGTLDDRSLASNKSVDDRTGFDSGSREDAGSNDEEEEFWKSVWNDKEQKWDHTP